MPDEEVTFKIERKFGAAHCVCQNLELIDIRTTNAVFGVVG